MFITVKYGNNDSLLCNPSCAVINLLSSIKRRAGFAHSSALLDLADETGTVKDLDQHHYDYASKHLASHGVYILVEKQVMVADEEETDDSSSQLTPHYTYRPLLDKCTDLYPNFRVQEHHTPEKRPPRKTQKSQSPSPAGLRNKGRSGKGNLSTRAPSRRK